MPMKFYHFTFSHLVGTEISAKILEVFDKGLTEYLMFSEERYLQKSKKLGEIIILFTMPPFIPKNKFEKNDTNRVYCQKSDQENWWNTEEN